MFHNRLKTIATIFSPSCSHF